MFYSRYVVLKSWYDTSNIFYSAMVGIKPLKVSHNVSGDGMKSGRPHIWLANIVDYTRILVQDCPGTWLTYAINNPPKKKGGAGDL